MASPGAVIIITRAVETSIQAVSPVFIADTGTGAAAGTAQTGVAAGATASSANNMPAPNIKPNTLNTAKNFFIVLSPFILLAYSSAYPNEYFTGVPNVLA